MIGRRPRSEFDLGMGGLVSGPEKSCTQEFPRPDTSGAVIWEILLEVWAWLW